MMTNDLLYVVSIIFAAIVGVMIGLAFSNMYWRSRISGLIERHTRTLANVSADCAAIFTRYFMLARLMGKPVDTSRQRRE